MKIAIEGCCHGELDKIYETIEYIQKEQRFKIDLLIVCGDFQSVRNQSDLQSMAVPPKYREMGTFYKYYSGEKKAPVLTVFIGGNHEATSYLAELPYGGWAAPNIYYMGYASVLQFNGIRIAGLSGIYKGHDYIKGHFETPPYTDETIRSAYHVRNLEVFRLKQIAKPLDIVVSHDWPRGIYYHGNHEALVRRKSFFAKEVEDNTLGSPVLEDLLLDLRPSFWFAAHLHVKFAAVVAHESPAVRNRRVVLQKSPSSGKGHVKTKFLALDKCLPRRQFLQVIDVESPSTFNASSDAAGRLCLDPEWLCILKSTDHLLNVTPTTSFMPSKTGTDGERFDFAPTEQEIEEIFEDFGGDLKIPENFEPTVEAYDPRSASVVRNVSPPELRANAQTGLICAMLGIRDVTAEAAKLSGQTSAGTEVTVDAALQSSNKSSDDVDEDSGSEEERLLLAALQSRRQKEPTTDEETVEDKGGEAEGGPSAEFPTFINDSLMDDDDDDDDVKVTVSKPVAGVVVPQSQSTEPLTSSIDISLTNLPSAATLTAPSSIDLAAGKRPSTGEAEADSAKPTPKKQFKRRNVALYSALGADI